MTLLLDWLRAIFTLWKEVKNLPWAVGQSYCTRSTTTNILTSGQTELEYGFVDLVLCTCKAANANCKYALSWVECTQRLSKDAVLWPYVMLQSRRGRLIRVFCLCYIYDLNMDYISKYVPECIKQIPVYMVRLRYFTVTKVHITV